jgi:hypothetical protein
MLSAAVMTNIVDIAAIGLIDTVAITEDIDSLIAIIDTTSILTSGTTSFGIANAGSISLIDDVVIASNDGALVVGVDTSSIGMSGKS